MLQNILVTGATGKQGGAVISALHSIENNAITIYALSRNITSPAALKLASRYNGIKLVSGSFDDPEAIFAACGVPISCVFAVQLPTGFPPSAEAEERHGKDLIDAAVAHGVKVYVQTSVDRGQQSDENPTKVPHFISKYNIEKHLERRAKEGEGRVSFTILRPASFMDNFAGGFPSKVVATAWRDTLPANLKVQMIAIKDIGWFAAQALTDPENDLYRNKSISLAGDYLSYAEIEELYQETTKETLPTTYAVTVWVLFKLVKEMSLTFEFFRDEGFSADIQSLRTINPGLTSFKMWLEQNKTSQS